MRWTDASPGSGDEPVRRDAGLRVDPVRVGRQRSAGAFGLAAAITVVLGVALLKPWGSPPTVASAAPRAVAVGSHPLGTPIAGVTDTLEPPGLILIRTATRASRISDWPSLAGNLDNLARQPIVSDRDLGGTHGDGTCGGTARITPFDELIGLVAPYRQRVAGVRLFAIDSISHPDLAVLIRSDRPGPLDGRSSDRVTVLEMPAGGLAPRQYALIADVRGTSGPRRLTYTICVG